MQFPPDPHSARSGIPVPSTVKRPSSNQRMSLAGPALRVPQPTPMRGPGTNPRQSMMRSQNATSLLSSTYRTPSHSGGTRSSLWPGATSSLIQTVKDPRPLRDKQYQAKMRQDIIFYLQGSYSEISKETLKNVRREDYIKIFLILVEKLDPGFKGIDPGRFTDEFVPTLEALRYPYAHQIDIKGLAAPGSMHSWPHLLGVLHWLVELCKLREDYVMSSHPTLQDPSRVPDEFDDAHDHCALGFDYYQSAYAAWLDMNDDFEKYNKPALEERYAKKNESVQEELERQKDLLAKVSAEFDKMSSSEPPVVKLNKENEVLTTDSEKFLNILQQYEVRKKKLIDTIAYEKAELATGNSRLEQLKIEHERLSDIVKSQNLTPEEIIKMNTDHETLQRNLEDLRQKLSETHRIVMSLEVTVTNRAAAAEEAVDGYTNFLTALGLFPPLPHPWQEIDLSLELNTAASNPQQLLIGADIRKVIKPTLNAIAESKRSERASLETERIRFDNDLDQLNLECENLEEEIMETEKKVASLNEQADDLRDAAQQDALLASNEASRLDRDISQAKTAAIANGMHVKSHLQTLQLSYQEQVEKAARLKEDTIRAILKSSHDIAIFKEEVSKHLGELREFADGA
ncbi:hypothetical protein M378DRAFT_170731 [Amanita muscaria Koide BX008]|uniref:Kinetochore protein NDC80 n=1 Tax=Amanita muscaria (strain Koide BX008) TaxID=946122 RepID=A0A0C2WNM9_AMAMK|nr:hypothetical protein M378DRAFT_170731 [Amanita muscaria Koide BX008]